MTEPQQPYDHLPGSRGRQLTRPRRDDVPGGVIGALTGTLPTDFSKLVTGGTVLIMATALRLRKKHIMRVATRTWLAIRGREPFAQVPIRGDGIGGWIATDRVWGSPYPAEAELQVIQSAAGLEALARARVGRV